MQILRADTQVVITVGPCVSISDGFTLVTTLAISTADAALLTKYNNATAVDISSNTFAAYATPAVDGYYKLTLTTTDTNTEGYLSVMIEDVSLCLPIRQDFMVVNANVYDSLYAATTTDYLQVDAIQISGSAATADRLEAWLNGFLTATVETGAGPTTTVFQTDLAEATDDHYNNSIVVFTGGTLLGQARRVSDYTGATGTITVDPALTDVPTNGDTIIIFPLIISGIDASGRVNVGRWLDQAVTLSGGNLPDVNIKEINDVSVTGTGTISDPWRV